METQQTQDPAQTLKAERVQEEMAALGAVEPFRLSLKAERVQEPAVLQAAGGAVSLGYEISCNQMQGVTVELQEPQIVVHLFTTGGPVAA